MNEQRTSLCNPSPERILVAATCEKIMSSFRRSAVPELIANGVFESLKLAKIRLLDSCIKIRF